MKTWKKIEETKRRAHEVTKLKQKNEERINNKMQQHALEQQKLMENRERVLQEKRQRELEK